ncbi:MAG: DEAD/DEAH box helicase [Verrucomicrobiota bacterium]|nr:DEAD/DEAH box helicase [Verrucomicrobiota bacterium]
MPSFQSLGLTAKLVEAVEARGYSEPTPIQAKAIPAILEGRDVMGGAQTGTGKTAAFALPILQYLFGNRSRHRAPRALVLAPTRELAAQVEKSFYGYSKGLGIYSCAIYGGVKMPPQVAKLRRGVGVVVATPGRLLDHASGGTIDLSRVEVLVLDEADRMLDMGFMPDIRKIIDLLPSERQNLMFSATYSKEIRALARELLNEPMSIEVAERNSAAEQVSQVVHPVERSLKRELLSHLISEGEWEQVLVFARTRHGAEKLAQYLNKNGTDAAAIHGDKSQGQRTRALDRFKRGSVRVLVATDVASRGLDIRQLPHVVNYEMPDVAEDYIHRIGRTGRAGEGGDAHSLVCRAEREKLAAVESLLRMKIPRREIKGYEGEDIAFTGKKSASGKRKSGSMRGRSRGGARGGSRDGARGGSRDGARGGSRDGARGGSRDGARGGSRDGARGGSRDGAGSKNSRRPAKAKNSAKGRGEAREQDRKFSRPKRSPKASSFSAEDGEKPRRTKPRKGKPKWSAARKRAAKLKRAGKPATRRPSGR